jgi:hypothetical protein
MRLDPAPPATLPVGSPVRMSFDYATAQSAAVQVVAIPMIGGAAAPDLDLRPAKGLDPGRGSGVAEFGVRKGPANVDGVRVRMYAAQQKEPLFETTLPARYAFSPAIAAQPPTAAKVQIVGAQCTRTGPDTYRVDVSGGASGPQQATLFIGVDVRFLSQPRPTLEVECGQWQRLSANSCTRADTPVAGTRWAYRHGFGSSQPPTHAMANVYDGPNPKTAKRIAEHRVEIDCR